MKITIDARLYGLENAGLGRYTLNLVNELAQLATNNSFDILLRKKYFNLLKLPSGFRSIEVEAKHYSLLEQFKLNKVLRVLHPDLVHFPHFNVPVMYKSPFVVTIHDLIMHQYKGTEATTLPFFLYGIKRLGYKAVFNTAVKSSSKIIVPSNFVKKELLRFYSIKEEKIEVIYEGITKVISAKGTRSSVVLKYGLSQPYFIYTGNAYPHKNLKRAIEAIVQLNRQSNKKYLFAIVSSRGIFSSRLEKVINSLKANDYVKVLGFVPDRELHVLYKNSLGFLYPSLYEGFGLPALEAMSCSTIALVSDIPVFKEIYKDSAIYFNPYDFSSITKALADVVELSQSEKEEKIAKSKLIINQYSWKSMAQKTLALYDSFK